jgi:hypothetical protein
VGDCAIVLFIVSDWAIVFGFGWWGDRVFKRSGWAIVLWLVGRSRFLWVNGRSLFIDFCKLLVYACIATTKQFHLYQEFHNEPDNRQF